MNYIEYQEKVNEIAKKAILPPLGKTAFVVIDMLNDGCREGGAFDLMGFDISLFQKIENNIADLVNECKKYRVPIIYVTSYYDDIYIPYQMKMKFKEMCIEHIPLAQKGTWGVEFVDSLPQINDYRVVKSHFSAFARGFSFAFKERSNQAVDEYLKKPAKQDEELKKQGLPVLNDFYLKASANESELSLKGTYSFMDSLPDFAPLTLHALLQRDKIDTLICTGGSSHVCLASTVYSASEKGYNIILPIDAIASEDNIKHWIYLHNFSLFNSALCTTTNLIDTILKQYG